MVQFLGALVLLAIASWAFVVHISNVTHQTILVEFGRLLFTERSLSKNGQVSCESCHQSARHFSDDRALALGVELGVRNTPSLENVGRLQVLMWDGRHTTSRRKPSRRSPIRRKWVCLRLTIS
ncbi:MAG: hypothetical protein HC933_15175 [Pleurocapsa sp. SU_196_0]|nr:hypothetical protein [Pleurocapsa sp. SU_196_0]